LESSFVDLDKFSKGFSSSLSALKVAAGIATLVHLFLASISARYFLLNRQYMSTKISAFAYLRADVFSFNISYNYQNKE